MSVRLIWLAFALGALAFWWLVVWLVMWCLR